MRRAQRIDGFNVLLDHSLFLLHSFNLETAPGKRTAPSSLHLPVLSSDTWQGYSMFIQHGGTGVDPYCVFLPYAS